MTPAIQVQLLHLPLQCTGRIPLNQFPHYPAHTGKPGPWDHHCSLDSLQGESSPRDSVRSVKQVCPFFWSAALQELLLCWMPSKSHTDPEARNEITSYKSRQIRQLQFPYHWSKHEKCKGHKTNFSFGFLARTDEDTTAFWVLGRLVQNSWEVLKGYSGFYQNGT